MGKNKKKRKENSTQRNNYQLGANYKERDTKK